MLLRRFGDLQHVLGAPPADLATLLAPDTVLELKLQHDLARRLLLYPMARRSVISSWTSLLSYLRVVCAASPRELFRVLFLDKKNELLAVQVTDRRPAVGDVQLLQSPRSGNRRLLRRPRAARLRKNESGAGDLILALRRYLT